MASATCKNGCCEWMPSQQMWAKVISRDHTGQAGAWQRNAAPFCPQTGEALGVDSEGQPVVEPRISAEYVRLLEELVEYVPPWWIAKYGLMEGTISGCYRRLYATDQPGVCAHEDPPLGCLRALAEAREKEAGV